MLASLHLRTSEERDQSAEHRKGWAVGGREEEGETNWEESESESSDTEVLVAGVAMVEEDRSLSLGHFHLLA